MEMMLNIECVSSWRSPWKMEKHSPLQAKADVMKLFLFTKRMLEHLLARTWVSQNIY